MGPYQNFEVFRKNIRHISCENGPLARVLERVTPASRLVSDASGALNIDLGGGALLYPSDARTAAERQVETYLEEPLRMFVPLSKGFDEAHIELTRHNRAMDQRLATVPRTATPPLFGGYLIVLGVGLGHHIQLLAEQLDFKTLIIVEPHDELIVHSLHAMDWAGLMQSLSRQGRDISFVRGGDLLAQIKVVLCGPRYPFIDGSYIYTHYQTEEFAALSRWLVHDRDLAITSGWFEDQLITLRNNIANFSRPGLYVQQARVASLRSMPAFVVGAGPSLDSDIEHIKRCRNDVILISASSALKVLLEHGLRPDIHCEVENSAGLGPVAETLAAKHGLSDIILYASSTVDPRISPCFKATIYVFRSGVSATSLLKGEAESTEFSGPTSGNGAFDCALSMGFREIYLFGLDFGARDPERHHSSHSVYFTYESDDEIETYTPYDFNNRVPGNFGGHVLSGYVLDLGRKSITDAITAIGNAQVMNCSDGSLIPRTRPMAAESLSFPPSAIGREREILAALSGLAFCSEPQIDPEDVKHQLCRAFHDFLDDCLEIIATTKTTGVTPQVALISLCDRLMERLGTQPQKSHTVFLTLFGHIPLVLQGALRHASSFDQDGAAEATISLLQGLTESFYHLGRLIDSEFSSHEPNNSPQ